MHYTVSDDIIACHIGTRVRKNHTSRRDAFRSIDVLPFSLVHDGQIDVSKQYADLKIRERHKNIESMIVKPKFENKVSLLKFHPGFDCRMIDYCLESGQKAIIIEGTGLGHVSKDCFFQINTAINRGIFVFMTSQCIWGRTALTVYDTGRDLLNLGVIPLFNTTSETALVKAMWCLANFKEENDVIKTMTDNIANEFTNRIILD